MILKCEKAKTLLLNSVYLVDMNNYHRFDLGIAYEYKWIPKTYFMCTVVSFVIVINIVLGMNR